LNLALLAGAPMTLERPLLAEDTQLFLSALEGLGLRVERRPDEVHLEPGPRPARARFDCGNAGTLYRFLVAALTTIEGSFTVDGSPRLRQRPIAPLVEALRRLGARIAWLGREGHAPLAIEGRTLVGGRARLDAGESSQFLSALLMAGLKARQEVELEVVALTSEPYVGVTIETAVAFGAKIERLRPGAYRVLPGLRPPDRWAVEGDYSAACYPAAAAALSGGRVAILGLAPGSAQGDRDFLALLSRLGARVEPVPGGWEVSGDGRLSAVDVDLSSMPDQVPTLAALAPFARGTTRIRGVAHLRLKESDRLAALAAELSRVGAEASEHADGLTIPGVWSERRPAAPAVVVDPHGDHRIAMSFALLGLRRPGLSVADPGVVAKSYPDFWRDLDALLR
jgi:3-phosphoshikimate 1-carboxyvinyltransferase